MRGVDIQVGEHDQADLVVVGDPGQLTQVFLNLVMNAIESTGRLPSAPRIVSIVFAVERAEVEILVQDNGPGFVGDDPEHMFQPFVSQRPEGLGMGLTISRTITEAHGGTLTAEHGASGGALLRVRLPLSAPASHG